MGIRDLNRYISDRCSKRAIARKPLLVLRNKTIVVDTSIYLYKYVGQSSLLSSFERMIELFQNYNITPIFIFDGKAPIEKRGLLRERNRLKKTAEHEYNALQEKLMNTITHDEKASLEKKMELLKTQMIRIKPDDIHRVKELFDKQGIQYLDAEGEADQLCASMVLQNRAWASLSDDMDLFVYGCPRVLRHLSLHNQTVLFYDFHRILDELSLTATEFRKITVISGTDYYHDQKKSNINLHETLRWYSEYKYQCRKNDNTMEFYDWLVKYTKYISSSSLIALNKTYSMFCIESEPLVV
jgi:5'-3' exonuclease